MLLQVQPRRVCGQDRIGPYLAARKVSIDEGPAGVEQARDRKTRADVMEQADTPRPEHGTDSFHGRREILNMLEGTDGYHDIITFRFWRQGREIRNNKLHARPRKGVLGLFSDRLPVTRLAWVENGPSLWWPLLPVILLTVALVASVFTTLRLKPAPPVSDWDEDDIPRGRPAQRSMGRAA